MTFTSEEIAAHRRTWLEALRSGGFKQAQNTLRKRNGAMCCLGVACEIAHKIGVTERRFIQPGEYEYGSYFDGTEEQEFADARYASITDLPTDVQEWLGVTDSAPDLASPVTVTVDGEEREISSLIELNDSYGFSFAQIADAIEEHGLA